MKTAGFFTKIIASFALLITTTLSSVGYAAITKDLTITGTGNADPQSGIFITDAKISSNIDANLTKSSVTQNGGCILTINTTLSNSNANSTLSYTVTFYNSTNDYYVYYKNASTRTNKEYITYSVSGMTKEQTIIAPKSYLTCTTTYKYTADPTTSNVISSDGIVNFSFTKCYNVTYENFTDASSFITYANPYKNFNVTLDNNIPVAVQIAGNNLSTSNFTMSDKNLTVSSSNLTGDIHVRKKTKTSYSNMIKNGSFENSSLVTGNASTGWAYNADSQYWTRTPSALGSYAACKRSCAYGNQHIKQKVTLQTNNVYYFYYHAMSQTGQQSVNSDISKDGSSATGTVTMQAVTGANGGYKRGSSRFTVSASSSEYYVNIAWNTNTSEIHIDGVGIINLTQIFGAGQEPSREWCDQWINVRDNSKIDTYI